MVEAREETKYLGLPNMIGRNKSKAFRYLKDKMLQRVFTWKENWISQEGREILIKNVAQAIHVYAMSLFLLPTEITKYFERCLLRYWWGSKGNATSGVHWMRWEKLSNHKMNGGLSFRDFNRFNLALLGKQCWRFMTEPNRLSSKLYKARYFADCHFLESKLGSSPSFIWRSIWEAKHVVNAGARWKVGNGKEITILNQPWIQDETHPYITSDLKGLNNVTVHSLRTEDGQQWDIDILQDLFNQRDQVVSIILVLVVRMKRI